MPAKKHFSRQRLEYNEGKSNEPSKFKRPLIELCRGPHTPKHGKKGGRPQLLLSDIVYAATTKVYLGTASRQLSDHMRQAHESGFVSQIPCARTVLNFFAAQDTAELLRGLKGLAAAPLNDVQDGVFAVDPTAFSLPLFKRWFDKEMREVLEKRQTVKCNLICSVKTTALNSPNSFTMRPSDVHFAFS